MKKRMPVHTVRPAIINITLPAAIRVYDQMENPSYDDAIAIWVLQDQMIYMREELKFACSEKIFNDEMMDRAEDFESYSDAVCDASYYAGEMKNALAEYLSLREKLFALL